MNASRSASGKNLAAILSAPVRAVALPGAETVRSFPRRRAGILLLFALAAFSLALAPTLRESGTPPGWDQSVHLRDSLVYERILRNPAALGGGVLQDILRGSEEYPLLTPSGYYPPLVPGVTALLYLVAGRSYETAMATNLLFLALLLWGVWKLGDRLMGFPAGVLAALFLLAAPGIRLGAGEYMLDLPLAAMVVLSTEALLATEGFSRRGRSLAFGLLCGAGMLTKWSFFLFLAPPLILALMAVPGEPARPDRPRAGRGVNLGLALLAAGAVMAPYYAPILPILIGKTVVHAGGAADGFGSPFTLESARFHLEALPRKLFGWPLTLSAAGGIAFFLFGSRENRRSRIFLGIWSASLYGIFTFAVANKQSRYLFPWLPILTLMAAGGIGSLWRRRGEAFAGARAVAVAILALPVAGLPGSWRPESARDWQVPRLVASLEADLAARPAKPGGAWKLGVLPDVREVNGPTLAYYVSRRDLPVTTIQLVNRMKRHVAVEVGLDPFDRGDFYQTFDDYDYLVTKTGRVAVPPWETVVPRMHAYFESRRGAFTELAAFREPDGSTVGLYRRNRG